MTNALWMVALAAASAHAASHGEVLGYLEDWVDVRWWDNNMPGNCAMGCFNAAPYIKATKPYSSVNYGFTLMTEKPNPDQVNCTNAHTQVIGGEPVPGPCDAWDGYGIWMADSSKQGAAVITTSTGSTITPGMTSIMDAARMAKQHPDGPKRFKVCLGGWSDWARLNNAENAEKVAKLMSDLVLATFADGVDLDFEHLTEFSTISGDDEFAAFNALIKALRSNLDGLKSQWASAATARAAQLQAQYDGLESWQKSQAAPYYLSTISYLKEVASNEVPQFELSWTTRFNAFLPKDNKWNYLKPGSPVPSVPFATDYEGEKIFPVSGDFIDTVNIMAYDAGPLQLNFTQIMVNFLELGKVPADKINIGFEPGEQAAGGIWEGLEEDTKTAHWVKENGIQGAFVWAVNPSPTTNPQGQTLCPQVAEMLNGVLQPTWRFGKAPTFTKCNPSTGYTN
eukprot:TRINITY_DN199_c0_g1_i1.p1 TRINITY_DN199_c0_g1~~TRINITY_DN199_c0_g1_i1.p1  ORF type:complete len:452 (+),score=241.91 TRINITY_DN199_c0_g1_i1:51-1406(+)